jgi:diguanylate cyclase (GGDEF)-like protein
MISIKRYLDQKHLSALTAEPDTKELFPATMDSYRAALLAFGKCAAHVCPGLGEDLDSNLKAFERRLSVELSAQSIRRAESQVEVQLQEWGSRTSEHFRTQENEVKELLIALAQTAESVGSRDQGYSTRFKELTGRLERIAEFTTLNEIRSSLVKSVTELKNNIDLMTRENQALVTRLRAEISTYETRLKSAEHLALKDELTGVANRRSVEERIQWNIANSHQFCIVMLDLNNFKQVNDAHGHLAGDDLLKQFSVELQLNTRSGDMVGRWGGDEFIVILSCTAEAAKAHIDRMQEWVFGKYTINTGNGSVVLRVDAAIGIAEWTQGQSAINLIAAADAAMYCDKGLLLDQGK